MIPLILLFSHVSLGTASSILGSAQGFTGPTTIGGILGVYSGTALTGAPTVTGSTDSADAAALAAQTDATAAFTSMSTLRSMGLGADLTGLTLTLGSLVLPRPPHSTER